MKPDGREAHREAEPTPSFPIGGGAMGALMRRHEWSLSPLGPPATWSPALRSHVSLMLDSKFPMFLAWGDDLGFLYNDAYAVILGNKHPAALGARFRDIWAEIWDDIWPLIERALAGEATWQENLPLTMNRRGRDERTWFTFSYSPARDEHGRVAGMFCACTETTGQVLAEAALRASEARASGVLEGMAEGFGLLDRDFRILDLNAEAMRLETRPRDEIIGRTHWEAYPGSEDSEIGRLYKRAMRERAPVGMEHRYVWADGHEVWLDMRAYPVEQGLAVFYRDVSDRRRAEERLRESEERFRFALEAADGIGTWDWDVAGNRVFASERFAEMYGLDPAAARDGLTVERYVAGIHADDQAEVGRLIDKAVRTGCEYRAEYRLVGRDGEVRWVVARGQCLYGPDGQPIRFPGVTFDITDRKRAEERLRQSETRLRVLGELDEALRTSTNAPGAMRAAAGLLARHLVASRCAYADVDADNDQFFIRDDYTAPGVASSAGSYSLDLFGSRAAADMRGGQVLVVRDVAGELAPDDGREMFQSIGIDAIICYPLVKAGRLVAMMAVHQDRPRDWTDEEVELVGATVARCWAHVERVGAQARLAESEERLRLATEAAEVGLWDVDEVNDVLIWPPRVKAMFGISPDMPVTMTDFYDGLHPGDREATGAAYAAAVDPVRRALYDVEYRTIGKEDGLIRWVAAKGRGVFDENGRCLRVIGSAIDITARKRDEERLRESEGRLARAFEAGELGAWELDPATLDAWRSPQHDRIFGYGTMLPEWTYATFLEHVVPEDRERVDAAFQTAIASGGRWDFECRIRRADGATRWIWAQGKADTGRDGRPGRVKGMVRDVTDRRAAEERLRALTETLEEQVAARSAERDRLWNLSPDMLARADYSGMMSAVNPAWNQVLGWSEGELLTRGYAAFMHPDDMPPTLAAIGRMAETREPARFENRIATADGGFKPIEWTVAPEADGLNFIAVGRDLSAAKAREAELETAQELLRQSQKMEAMGSLTGGVAHDFNNLLTPIIGSLDLLQRKELGGERERRLVDGALQSAERARVLVQRLLAFARRQPLQPRAVDVGALVAGMADLVSSTTGPRIEVVVDVADGLPAAVADPNQIEMAILNLSVNARDAMADGGTLRISAEDDSVEAGHRSRLKPGRYVRLSVADTGAGMDEETLARAVEPFFSTKGVGRGTGLGLSMVHGLASQLGGALGIESRPGHGTNVEIWLPTTEEAASRPEAVEEAEARPVTGTALVVDDEELVRASTADMLAELGYAVVEAGSAEEALRLVDNGQPLDVLVTDHLMPGMTGTQLVRELRDRRPGARALVVSGYADADGVASDLPRLVKPFRKADLAAKLGELDEGSPG